MRTMTDRECGPNIVRRNALREFCSRSVQARVDVAPEVLGNRRVLLPQLF